MLSKMAHTCIGVQDLDRAVKFYTETLGMTVTARRKLPSGSTLVLVSPGGDTEIELTHNKAFVPRAQGEFFGLRHIAFWVEDLDAVVTQLKARGVSFYREPGPGQNVAFFKDPEGVDIELMEQHSQ